SHPPTRPCHPVGMARDNERVARREELIWLRGHLEPAASGNIVPFDNGDPVTGEHGRITGAVSRDRLHDLLASSLPVGGHRPTSFPATSRVVPAGTGAMAPARTGRHHVRPRQRWC